MKVRKHPHAGHTGHVGEFLRVIGSMTKHGMRHAEVFDDFLEAAFCAVAKTTHLPGERAEALEERYMRVVRKRPPDYVAELPKLLGLMTLGVQAGGVDFLGKAAGELGSLSEHLGQFFTPYEVSRLIVKMTIDEDLMREKIAEKGYIDVGEPACGSGGMLLAVAEALEELGFDPSKHMLAHATDLSSLAFRMAYLQLDARGIPAKVVHGNTLTLETFGCEVTPAFVRFEFERRAAALAADSVAAE